MNGDWHVVITGRGRSLVGIHGGLGLDHQHLHRGLAPLAARARLVLPDLRGNGRTPAPASWEGYRLLDWAEDLDALREALGLSRWTMVAHSLGAFVALEYAVRYPDRLDALVLVSAAGAFDHAPRVITNAHARGAPAVVERFVAAFSAPLGDDDTFADVWREVLPLYFHRWDPVHLDAFAGTRYCAAALAASLAALAGHDARPRLPWIRCPTLVVSGDDDFITPGDLGLALAGGIEGARHAVIPACGHFPFLEAPARFHATVAEFLDGVEPRP
jgi:proline iminopeptidase